MSRLSREYVSESDVENEEEYVAFTAPSDYKKCKHLKKFHKKAEEQLWLIKLPSNLDISKLKTLPIDYSGDKSGDAVITVEGENTKMHYNISENVTQQEHQDNSNLSLLIPDDSRDSLYISDDKNQSLTFDRVFTVSEVASIPGIDYEKLRVPRSNVVKVEGLKMRHFPTGYDAKDYEGAAATPKEEKKTKKRSAEELASSPSKKHNKKEKKKKAKE